MEIWNVGWYSTLVIQNNTDQSVNYTIRHIPYYGAQFNPDNGWITRFTEQVVIVPIQPEEEKRISLMELYGWSTTQSANMEGCLLIDPDKDEARKTGTTASLLIDPNKRGKPLHESIH